MPHHVYANTNEICSKSADGTSVMAADVCFSPGAPHPGAPILYMNSCQASDISDGSKSVRIKGQEICLENRSYFATSYGDEPATQGLMRGINSHAVQGKCYFISWSPDVFVEGLAVTRHLDMVTHNHGSPPNTDIRPYLSSAEVLAKCKEEIDEINKKCKPDDEATKQRKKTRKTPFGSLRGEKHNQATEKQKDPAWNGAWMEDHCDGLWIKPGSLDPENIERLRAELDALTPESLLEYAKEQILNLDNLPGFLAERGLEIAIGQGEKWLVRAAVTHTAATAAGAVGAVGGPTVVVTEGVAHTVGLVVDVLSLVWSLGAAGFQLYQELDILWKIEDMVKEKISAIDHYKDLFAREKYSQVMAEAMEMMAILNACTRARRCILVKFNDTNLVNGNGCCPGQTGHHILPKQMMAGRASGACEKYSDGTAATVCVEGADRGNGSHGKIHRDLFERIEDYKKGDLFNFYSKRDTITVNDAIEIGVESVRSTFPESRCDKACLTAQLEDYYINHAGCSENDTLRPAAGSPARVAKASTPQDGATA